MTTLGFKSMRVYMLAYKLALELFHETKKFPPEERFDLTDQIRRSSRSIPRNLAEAWRRRMYPKAFILRVVDCSAEASETEVSLTMALDCGYLPRERFDYFMEGYDEIQRMLSGMLARPERFVRGPGESNA